MHMPAMAVPGPSDCGHREVFLRPPPAGVELLSMIQMLHERLEILERDNEMLRSECRLAAEFRLIMHERHRLAEGH